MAITINRAQLNRANELAGWREAALGAADYAVKQPETKDFRIEVMRQGAPLSMVINGAELFALAINIAKRMERELSGYGIEVNDAK
jgi:hypothetical protein